MTTKREKKTRWLFRVKRRVLIFLQRWCCTRSGFGFAAENKNCGEAVCLVRTYTYVCGQNLQFSPTVPFSRSCFYIYILLIYFVPFLCAMHTARCNKRANKRGTFLAACKGEGAFYCRHTLLCTAGFLQYPDMIHHSRHKNKKEAAGRGGGDCCALKKNTYRAGQ